MLKTEWIYGAIYVDQYEHRLSVLEYFELFSTGNVCTQPWAAGLRVSSCECIINNNWRWLLEVSTFLLQVRSLLVEELRDDRCVQAVSSRQKLISAVFYFFVSIYMDLYFQQPDMSDR